MKAGRELDALVAEKVFGCKVDRRPWPNGEARVSCGCRPMIHRNDDPVWDDELPYYSTDIAAAWEVAERASLFDYYTVLRKNGDVCQVGDFAIDRHDHMEFSVDAEAETAPLAICLAALKAVE